MHIAFIIQSIHDLYCLSLKDLLVILGKKELLEIGDQLGPQGTSRCPGATGGVKNAQVSTFPRIQSNLPSSKLHYGKTYSNFISGFNKASIAKSITMDMRESCKYNSGGACDCICDLNSHT